MMPGAIDPPFGTHALPGALERLRRAASGLGSGAVARRAASLIRRACLAGRPDPVDVEPFPGQRARLYPRDNLSEKRVFCAPQFWDGRERAALARAMRETPAPFRFVDAGANAGLYTLAVRSLGPARVLAVEPDPENLRRLRDNLAASGAGAEVTVAPVALSDRAGRARLAAGGGNRGEVMLDPAAAAGVEVETVPLADLLARTGFDRVDALKIDIEGQEDAVLAAFLREAAPSLRPRLVILEARRGARTAALALMEGAGYVVADRSRMNVILAAPAGYRETAAGAAETDLDGADGKA